MADQSGQETGTGGPTSETQTEAPPAGGKRELAWYRDPPKVAGVLGFILALATLGERALVRSSEETERKLQALRDTTSALVDVQTAYLEAVTANPANVYSRGVTHNTKRQMLIQTADALLADAAVKAGTSAQVLAALGSEVMSDGRYVKAKSYLEDALRAPGADDNTTPFIVRALGQLHALPSTGFTDLAASRRYFDQALALFDARGDDAGHLWWAETVLTEASRELTYGDVARAQKLAFEADARLGRVRSVSPFKVQLARIAAALQRGEQFAQTQDPSVQAVAAMAPVAAPPVTTGEKPAAEYAKAEPSSASAVEVWEVVPGQVSGVEMTVSVNGKDVGTVSNLTDRRTLALPTLPVGSHKFGFHTMKAYFIDPVKGPSVVGQGLGCEGLFEVSAGKTRLRANVGTGPRGLMCTLQ